MLDHDFESGVKSETKPHARKGLKQGPPDRMGRKASYFGNTADTAVVTFNNGHKWVRKRDLHENEQKNEVLASLIGRAVGTDAPIAFRHDDVRNPQEPADWPVEKNVLWEPYIPGSKSEIEWLGGLDSEGEPLGDNQEYDLLDTDAGRRIGVLDFLTGNADRHYGNIMVTKDGTPVPIDHGNAGNFGMGTSSPFTEHLTEDVEDQLGHIPLNRFSPEDWSEMRARLMSLKPDFDAEGKGIYFGRMINQLRALHKVAENGPDGTR
jgi:hypothetical protein